MCFCYAVASEPSRQRGIDGRVRRIDGGRIPLITYGTYLPILPRQKLEPL
jgi:hypothetical protein